MPTAHEILKSVFGYDSFRPMQEEIIEHVVSRRDALVLMPTGGGKSICYQIPALMFKGITVVISPLISLMKDQVDALNANGIGADALNSNNEEGENAAIRQRCKAGQTKILYISPERLQREIPWMQQHLNVSLFAIDEAHCISQWGHDFRPEYTQLGGLHQAFPSATVMALTATADKLTKEDIVRQLNLRDFRLFVSSFDLRPSEFESRCAARLFRFRKAKSHFVHHFKAQARIGNHLLPFAQEHRKSRRRTHQRWRLRESLPCGANRRRTQQCARGFHQRQYRCRVCDNRIRHGHRQEQCPLCHPLQSPQEHREFLSRDWARGPRRPPLRNRAVLQLPGHHHAPQICKRERPARHQLREARPHAGIRRIASLPSSHSAQLLWRPSNELVSISAFQ